jgi:methyl-accepting chemotaxis protein
MKLAQISIRTRLILFALLALVMLVAASGYSLIIQRAELIAIHRNQRQEIVDIGQTLIMRYGNRASDAPAEKLATGQPYAPWGWVVSGGVYIDDIDNEMWRQAKRMAIGLIIAMLVLQLIAWRVTRSITQPIDEALAAANVLAEGDLGAQVATSSTTRWTTWQRHSG